jgi:hypothetical protein
MPTKLRADRLNGYKCVAEGRGRQGEAGPAFLFGGVAGDHPLDSASASSGWIGVDMRRVHVNRVCQSS